MGALNELCGVYAAEMNSDDMSIKKTTIGIKMSKQCIAMETVKMFQKTLLEQTEGMSAGDIILMIAGGEEFADITLRNTDKKPLKEFNKRKRVKDTNSIVKFPLPGDTGTGCIKTAPEKVSVLLQATLGLLLEGNSFSMDVSRIWKAAPRVANFLIHFAMHLYKVNPETLSPQTLNSCVQVASSVNCKCWWESPYIARQLEHIGPTLAKLLVDAKLDTHDKLLDTPSTKFEEILNRRTNGFGSKLKQSIEELPRLQLQSQFDQGSQKLSILVTVLNPDTATANNWDDDWVVTVGKKGTVLMCKQMTALSIINDRTTTILLDHVLQPGDKVNIYLGSIARVGLNKRTAFELPALVQTAPPKLLLGIDAHGARFM
jgi:hypothetical protein